VIYLIDDVQQTVAVVDVAHDLAAMRHLLADNPLLVTTTLRDVAHAAPCRD